MAAETILAAHRDYSRPRLDAYRRQIDARFGPRAKQPTIEQPPSPLRRWLAHWLLRRGWFVRHVLMDRWFLHARQGPLALTSGQLDRTGPAC
jgi:hypothetical protein